MKHDSAGAKILVVGCGSIGRRHVENLLSLRAGEVLVFDADACRCRAVQAELGATTVESLEEAWSRAPTIALIATPTNLHIEAALEAARHGCHLFIEKPLSHTADGLTDLLAEIDRKDLVTLVACNMRFHPGPAKVKRLLQEQRIGRVLAARIQTGSYLPRWRPSQDYRSSYSADPVSGGAILDCIHEIDLALWYLGPAKLLSAAHIAADAIGLQTDGLAELILHHDSGAISNVHLNFVQRDRHRSCQIIGTEGTIYWDFSRHCVTLHGPDGEIAEEFPGPAEWQFNQMFSDELEHFLEAVDRGASTVNTVRDAMDALTIALAAKHGKEQPVA